MKPKQLPILILFSLWSNIALSQTILSKNKAKANTYFMKNHYHLAAINYKKCIKSNQGDLDAISMLGICYKKLNKTKQALVVFEYLEKKRVLNDSLWQYYLDCLKKNKNYEKAFAILSRNSLNDSLKQVYKAQYDSIKKWIKKPQKTKITNLSTLNTKFSELAPVLYNNGTLVYLSNQEGMIIKKREDCTGMPNYNIYKAQFKGKDSTHFRNRKLFSEEVNSQRQEGGVCFSSNYRQVYYSRAFREFDKSYRFKLFLSEKSKNTWGQLKEFAFNDSTASFTHPNISTDGNLFFFSSDMPGGYGGKDLYVCVKIDSLWSAPMNVGPPVNTSKNEIFPFYSNNGNLYFSSDGHTGLGGYDLYKAIQEDGEWKRVVNLKPPINTNCDEFSIYIIDSKESKGYFASNRPQGKGLEDIYHFEYK